MGIGQNQFVRAAQGMRHAAPPIAVARASVRLRGHKQRGGHALIGRVSRNHEMPRLPFASGMKS